MRTIDIFCGCGGMSLGFQKSGYQILEAFDNWPIAIDTYSRNFDHKVTCHDLLDYNSILDSIIKNDPQLIVGGPPCQDFSLAGLGNEGKRANLTLTFGEIVSLVRPEYFVMENVYNIERSTVLPKLIKLLKDSNYGLSQKVIDASYIGVPQMRKRYFLLGKLDSQDGFIDKLLDSRIGTTRTSVRDYFKDELNLEYYYAHPRTYKRRAVFSVDEPSATIRRVNRPIPKNYKKHPADKSEVNSTVRPLTTDERSQIQTFPKSFTFKGSKSQQEQQIGNAVPVLMASFVAKTLKLYAEN